MTHPRPAPQSLTPSSRQGRAEYPEGGLRYEGEWVHGKKEGKGTIILPDGSQYWCGGHSVSRPAPVGNVLEHSVQDNIHAAMAQHAALPTDSCRNCPGATLAINQEVERRLLALIAEWIAAADAVRPAADALLPVPSSEGAGG